MDIEALAKRAGMITELQSGAASCVWTDGLEAVSAEQLTTFARLVQVEESESCAWVCGKLAASCMDTPDGKAMRTAYAFAEAEIKARSNDQVNGPRQAQLAEGPR